MACSGSSKLSGWGGMPLLARCSCTPQAATRTTPWRWPKSGGCCGRTSWCAAWARRFTRCPRTCPSAPMEAPGPRLPRGSRPSRTGLRAWPAPSTGVRCGRSWRRSSPCLSCGAPSRMTPTASPQPTRSTKTCSRTFSGCETSWGPRWRSYPREGTNGSWWTSAPLELASSKPASLSWGSWASPLSSRSSAATAATTSRCTGARRSAESLWATPCRSSWPL
mmetsp:Transcript_72384/g.212063  ORF Transcript_72384/g.212063 Transcript_72384/m.212063 type:complete len:221 (+) Transcript_72384:498-1160(+)